MALAFDIHHEQKSYLENYGDFNVDSSRGAGFGGVFMDTEHYAMIAGTLVIVALILTRRRRPGRGRGRMQ